MIFENIEITSVEKNFMLSKSNIQYLVIEESETRILEIADDLVMKGFLEKVGTSTITSLTSIEGLSGVVHNYKWRPLAYRFFKYMMRAG